MYCSNASLQHVAEKVKSQIILAPFPPTVFIAAMREREDWDQLLQAEKDKLEHMSDIRLEYEIRLKGPHTTTAAAAQALLDERAKDRLDARLTKIERAVSESEWRKPMIWLVLITLLVTILGVAVAIIKD